MNALFVARRYFPAIGGVASFLRHIARELGSEHRVTVLAVRIDSGKATRLSESLAAPPPFEPFDDGPVRVKPLRITAGRRALLSPLLTQVTPGLRRYAYGRMRLATTALYARTLAPLIASAEPEADVVHAWIGDQLGASAVRAAQLLGVPSAVSAFVHKGQYGDDLAAGATYRAANAVFALLETEAEVYRQLGVAPERIHVTGVCSPGVPAGGGRGLRERLGLKGPIVLFLGVRRAYKGVDILLEAAAELGRSRPDITFAFVGPGPALVPPSGARVLDVGEVSEDERAAWLDAADLLCLPSANEILPGSFLEAWSVSTPVLTSDIPTLRELVTLSGGGALSPRQPRALADAILQLVADPQQLAALGRSGNDYWQANCTVTAVTSHLLRVYEMLRADRSGRRRAA